MSDSFEELQSGEACPCASGRKYGKCCARKRYRFGRDASGAVVRQVDLVPEATELFKEAFETYRELYGRDPRPTDPVFSFSMSSAENVYTMAREFLRAGVPPDLVYAFCRTEGLLPTEENSDFISEKDLQDFSRFRREYKKLLKPPAEGRNAVNSVWLVATGNQYIADVAADTTLKVHRVLNNFLSRHVAYGGFVDFEIKTPLDYCLFSAYKTRKTLDSISYLAEHSMPEAIYALSRGIFENYLYLNAIATDPGFFAEKVLPKADRENFTFTVKDGRINYNQVIHKVTGAVSSVWVTPRELLRYATPQDRELFDLFYQTACQFVHVDVLSARAYFHETDPFDEFDSATVAHLVSIVLIGQLVRALSRSSGIDEHFQADADHFLGILHPPIATSLELVNSDPEHQNDVYATLSGVVGEWRLVAPD
jgi:hypothetical protein